MPINPVDLKPGDVFTCDELPFASCIQVGGNHPATGPGMMAYLEDATIHPHGFFWPINHTRWAKCQLLDRSVLTHWMGRFAGEGI